MKYCVDIKDTIGLTLLVLRGVTLEVELAGDVHKNKPDQDG